MYSLYSLSKVGPARPVTSGGRRLKLFPTVAAAEKEARLSQSQSILLGWPVPEFHVVSELGWAVAKVSA